MDEGAASAALSDLEEALTQGGVDGFEPLKRELQDFGLTPNEAAVSLELLRCGSADAAHLARACNVSRTNIYKLMAALVAKLLAERLPGAGPARWASPGRERLVAQLCANQRERLRQLETRAERVQEMLERAIPATPSTPLSYVRLIPNVTDAQRHYEELVATTRHELLLFSKPPYSWDRRTAIPAVMDALKRGISIRVLYEAKLFEGPDGEAWRESLEPYFEAGAKPRLADDLPMKLVVYDRTVAQVTLTNPLFPATEYPTALLIDHSGFAQALGDAFEQQWLLARPYPFSPKPPSRGLRREGAGISRSSSANGHPPRRQSSVVKSTPSVREVGE